MIEGLLEKGERIKALVRPTSNTEFLEELGVDIVVGDLLDRSTLMDHLQDVHTVYHIAANVDDFSSKEEIIGVNVEGTRNLAEEFAATNGKRFVYLSSTGVYGLRIPLESQPVPETYPPNPTTVYQQSKLGGEEVLFEIHNEYDIGLVVIRSPSIFGPRDVVTTLKLALKLKDHGAPIVGSGDSLLALSYVKDVVEALILAGREEDTIGEIYNVTSVSTTCGEYFQTICDMMGYPTPRKIPYRFALALGLAAETMTRLRRKEPKTSLSRYRVRKFALSRDFDSNKIRTDLGFKPQVDLKTGLRNTIDWLQSNGWLE